MPKFELNQNYRKYESFSAFEKQYVEAMFFTNGDTCSNNEDHLNKLGVARLTNDSLLSIKVDCTKFLATVADGKTVQEWLDQAETDSDCNRSHCAAHDLWYSRQGHGCGFWDGDWPAPYADVLDGAAKALGESFVEVWQGWIHVH